MLLFSSKTRHVFLKKMLPFLEILYKKIEENTETFNI